MNAAWLTQLQSLIGPRAGVFKALTVPVFIVMVILTTLKLLSDRLF